MFSLACKAVLFDLDGVLIDSNDLYEAHWRSWAEERGMPFKEILSVHHGRPIPETIRLVAPHLDAMHEAQVYKDGLIHCRYWHMVRPYAGAAKLLHSLPPRMWAIVTSAPKDIAMRHLTRMRLPVPDVLITGDDVVNGKPAPDPWLQASQDLGTAIHDCVVVEDAPAGITSAIQAGARVIALTTTNPPDLLQDADLIAPDLAALTVVLKSGCLQLAYPPKTASKAASV